jgi:DNA replication ATP-dependent helicase Dna2
MGSQLKNERDTRTGEIIPAGSKPYDKEAFWEHGIGIVTPHRAQQALIVSRLQHVFAPYGIDGSLIRGAVDTVERFQGQQRDIIIASYALGDEDAIRDEEEFLMSLNRFNVMVSRARAKIIALVSQEVIKHLSDDVDVLRESRLLKVYADSFCNVAESITLGHFVENEPRLVEGLLKNHSCDVC